MTRFLVITLFLITVGCSTNTRQRVSSVEQLPYYSEATFTPEWFDTEDGVPDDYHQIPSFSLVNQSGETLTEKDVEGKIYVADFFFTSCPGICPKMTTNMQLVQEAFINDK
ncbi:MAG: SCO family protein, partial [Cyclobacteriaceae bacterium]